MKLQEWCENKKLEYKILLADNGKNVNRLKRIVNRAGCMITNLEGCSLTELAKRIVIEDFAQNGELVQVELADHDECVLFVNQLLKSDHFGKYSFVPEECLCVQTSEEILRVINVLRMGKTTPEFAITSIEKEQQIRQLIQDYEEKLEKEHLYDNVRILKDATQILKDQRIHVDAEIGILSYMLPQLTYVERLFMDALTSSPTEIACERESQVTTAFYEVYGQENEIELVISQMKEEIDNKRMPFGQVNILYSTSEYENAIRAALAECGIPHAFVSGCSVRDQSYISFLLALITWAKDEYSYDAFQVVAQNVLVKLGKDYSFGKKACIGWGLDRYEMFADKMKNDKKTYQDLLLKHGRISEFTSKEDGTTTTEDCSERFVSFISDLAELFRQISKAPYNVGVMYRQILRFIEDDTKKRNQDLKYLTLLKRKRNYFDRVGTVDSFSEALDDIYDEVSSLQMEEEEASNVVTVVRMGRTEVLERPYQFCIGMSYDAFGSGVIDSPVLSDERLTALIDGSAGYVDRVLNNNIMKKEKLLRSLSSMPDGKLVVSASIYDTRNFRKTAVSEAFLELQTKYHCASVMKAGYMNQLDLNTNYTVDKATVYRDADASSIQEPKHGYINEEIQNGYRVVKLGKLSPTALQNMMGCSWKFDYYIKYFEDDNLKRDVTKWLPANEIGNFFHRVFQTYCESRLVNKALSASDEPDIAELTSIFDQTIEEFETLVPKGSEQAYEIEKKTMWELIETYICELYKDFKENDKQWVVKECEREFTSDKMYIDENGDYVAAPGTCDVIEFFYHGFLDRMDTYVGTDGEEHARIIDYKTGKRERIKDKIKKDKTQIQHVIYSMAVPEDVEYFSYDFPCDGNDKLALAGEEIGELPESFRERMASVLLKGKYELTDPKACDYCEYMNICIHRMNLE